MNKQNSVPKKRVLVIEDNNDVSMIVCAALKTKGYEILTATEGFEGFYKARREQPDLIILDLNLPRLPGEEVCKAIREDDDFRFSKMPIIMLTAKAEETDRIIGKVIGSNLYLTKPFDVDFLLKCVHDLMDALKSNEPKGGNYEVN